MDLFLCDSTRVACAAPQDRTPLHLAAAKGHVEVVMALLDRSGAVKSKDVSWDAGPLL
jgi:ankyrin repeat protein